MPFSFLCDAQGTVQSISGVTLPINPNFVGTTNIIGGLSNASITNWEGQIAKTRNFPADPSAGNCLIVVPTATQGVIRTYAFTQANVLSNLWRVPDASGNPIISVGTTLADIAAVKNACGNAGCIYYDNTGIFGS